jgi:mannose-1-phosphate guanylyltransferase
MTSSIKGVILVGGPSRGTRFRPLSLNHPKPLFPIAGKPMIYHQILALSKIVKEVLIIGYYEPEDFASFVEKTSVELKLSVKYLREYQPLSTG